MITIFLIINKYFSLGCKRIKNISAFINHLVRQENFSFIKSLFRQKGNNMATLIGEKLWWDRFKPEKKVKILLCKVDSQGTHDSNDV